MSGIYFHIPFCKQACNYCDFHFSTSLNNKKELLETLKKEMHFYKDYFQNKKINTLYFGGGTPSLLHASEIEALINEATKYWDIDPQAEITLEANPDDLTQQKINELKQTPVNRLSIGIQSFFDDELKYMNRAHNSSQAMSSVKESQDAGFNNITIDLIYGVPVSSNEKWLKNLEHAFNLNVQHLSCYSLTVEPKTTLDHLIKTGKSAKVDEERSAEQFELLMNAAEKNNFIQYEISNFGKEGFFSKHNSNYWLKEHYLGIGPSAHSYNGVKRHWNIRNNSAYIKGINENLPTIESETITTSQQYNEYIMTSLRTIWGVDMESVKKINSKYVPLCFSEAQPYITSGHLIQSNNKLFITNTGKLIADRIASDLFIVE